MNAPVLNLSSLSALLALLVALSVAAERLVEIIKNLPRLGEWLKTENPDAAAEGWRRLVLQLLAVGAGILTAWLAREVLPVIPDTGIKGKETTTGALLVLGLLASGGSGFWTSILGYVRNIKEIKKAEAVDTKVRAAATVAAVAQGATPLTTPSTQQARQVPAGAASPASPEIQRAAQAALERTLKLASATLSPDS